MKLEDIVLELAEEEEEVSAVPEDIVFSAGQDDDVLRYLLGEISEEELLSRLAEISEVERDL